MKEDILDSCAKDHFEDPYKDSLVRCSEEEWRALRQRYGQMFPRGSENKAARKGVASMLRAVRCARRSQREAPKCNS